MRAGPGRGRGRLPEGTAPSPGSGPQKRVCVCRVGEGGRGGCVRGVEGEGDGHLANCGSRIVRLDQIQTVGGDTCLAEVTMTCLWWNPVL